MCNTLTGDEERALIDRQRKAERKRANSLKLRPMPKAKPSQGIQIPHKVQKGWVVWVRKGKGFNFVREY